MIALVDIGGTNIKYGLYDLENKSFEAIGSIETNAKEANFHITNRLFPLIDHLHISYCLKGIAICTAGVVNPKSGLILHANDNLPNYKGTPLRALLEERYDIPVSVINDVNAALLGELHSLNQTNLKSAFMMTLGTGVGGAIYIDGKIHHGRNLAAAEIGYIDFNGKSIESQLSTRSLIKEVAKLKAVSEDDIDGKWIFNQAIDHQDQICIQAIKDLMDKLVDVIKNINYLLSPDLIILGGGIMEQADYLRRVLDTSLADKKDLFIGGLPQIEFARLGNDAGLLGAFVHFFDGQDLVI